MFMKISGGGSYSITTTFLTILFSLFKIVEVILGNDEYCELRADKCNQGLFGLELASNAFFLFYLCNNHYWTKMKRKLDIKNAELNRKIKSGEIPIKRIDMTRW